MGFDAPRKRFQAHVTLGARQRDAWDRAALTLSDGQDFPSSDHPSAPIHSTGKQVCRKPHWDLADNTSRPYWLAGFAQCHAAPG